MFLGLAKIKEVTTGLSGPVLEIKFTSCKRHRSAESRVRKCTRYACALCGHSILLFGNMHARFYFISVHAVPVQLHSDAVKLSNLSVFYAVATHIPYKKISDDTQILATESSETSNIRYMVTQSNFVLNKTLYCRPT